MKYYYAQCETKDRTMLKETFLEYIDQNEEIYLDDEVEDHQWITLSSRLKEHDELWIHSLARMSLDTTDLKRKLLFLQEMSITLVTLDETIINSKQVLETIDFTLKEGLYRQKLRQRLGIQKALEDKRQGTGSYGRPRTQVPDDFAENIRAIMAKRMSHESYRASLNMKRSTYFKMVKELKDSWKKYKDF